MEVVFSSYNAGKNGSVLLKIFLIRLFFYFLERLYFIF